MENYINKIVKSETKPRTWMTFDELKVVYENATLDITSLYKNELSSKLKLAVKIASIESEKKSTPTTLLFSV